MTTGVSETLLSRFSEFLAAQMGLYFPQERLRDLERGMTPAARDFGFKDAESCIQWLMSAPLTKDRIEILAGHFTVGETYFFREKRLFEILQENILPELIHSRQGSKQRLRIWSAGCCTGEEPYSVAILLSRMLLNLNDWNISILATDINTHFLQKAAAGVYSNWSFRDTPPWVKERYFKKTNDGRFQILPQIKRMVKFSYHNLAEDTYLSLDNDTKAMDIIFCRNVLMYFASEHGKKVVQKFYRSLVNGGWLMVSPTDAAQVPSSLFARVNLLGAVVYQKKDRQGTGPAKDFAVKPGFKTRPVAPLRVQTGRPETNRVETAARPVDRSSDQPVTQELSQTQYGEALALYEQGLYKEAAEKLIVLFSKNTAGHKSLSSNGKAMALLARAYANQGKLAEAKEWCENAITADKTNQGYYYLLATIIQEQGLVEDAKTALKRALYLDQDFVLAHFVLGNLTRQEGNLKEADKHFQNVLLLLQNYGQVDILPESEGITAGRLAEIITSMTKGETLK